MVRVSSEQGIFFKLWHFIMLLWEIVMLFFASLFKKNPREVTRDDATPFRSSSYRPGGSWGGSGGGSGPGGSGGGRPGSNIRGLPKYRGVMRMPMGGGG